MATPPLVTWNYADWRSQSTESDQLARLALHLEEISGFVLTSSAKGHSLSLQQTYMKEMQSEYDRLQRKISVRQFGSNRFGVSSFQRGAGP